MTMTAVAHCARPPGPEQWQTKPCDFTALDRLAEVIADRLLARVPEVPMSDRCSVQLARDAMLFIAGARPHGEIVIVGDCVLIWIGPNAG